MTAAVPAGSVAVWSVPGSDADHVGQVLCWSPRVVSDFADLARAVGQLLGDGVGVRGIDVHRAADGSGVFVYVAADTVEYVEQAAATHHLHLHRAFGYASAWGQFGEAYLTLTWIGAEVDAETLQVSS